ncbi:MAG: GNAT family N-acetyltransferase [Gammaproteobacteria bacterium]|nr:GNAT family N-acetyltransferase [Gammaproteobacteria bacterium]
MSDFALTQYQDKLHSIWNDVVNKSKNGNFLFLREYMDYHACRFDEQSVIVEKGGKPVAIFPCNRIEDRIISHSGLTYAGLIYGDGLHATEILEIFGLLVERYREMGCRALSYKAIPHIFHGYPAEEDLYALFRLGAQLVRRDISSVVRMANRIKLSDSRKCTIQKAVKHGVEIREGEFFDAYHQLLASALARFGAKPVHSVQELQLLRSRFPDRIRLFGAFSGNQLLAGALVYDFGSVAHTQYLASSDEGRDVGALDCAIAHLLDNVFASRHYFSFGISTEQDGRHLNQGLIFQKEGFGGRGLAHDFYELAL